MGNDERKMIRGQSEPIEMPCFLAFRGHLSMLSTLNILGSTMLKTSIPKIVFNELYKTFRIVLSFSEAEICRFLL